MKNWDRRDVWTLALLLIPFVLSAIALYMFLIFPAHREFGSILWVGGMVIFGILMYLGRR